MTLPAQFAPNLHPAVLYVIDPIAAVTVFGPHLSDFTIAGYGVAIAALYYTLLVVSMVYNWVKRIWA